ncbi:hypothetical protein SAMN04515620_1249 [Collimonas sp. OK607]|uniref:hypothetical protein n=1 Tax=Collimonas sp. OK607 TaxID=1798194 RepID=UPI0008F10A7A|nr:hypothetical protein [Collimonas sp. OK607]SFB18769.1 hypothetical protein SAMN04515620_1249 [Collimonas sp. OK607]
MKLKLKLKLNWEFLNKRVAVFFVLTVVAVGLVSWINVLSPEDRPDESGRILQKALASQGQAKSIVR